MTALIIALAVALVLALAAAVVAHIVEGERILSAVAGVIVFIVVAPIGSLITVGYHNPRDLVCYVEDKDRARTDSGSDARIYTRECGVLNVQDLFWAREFRSADTFARIEPGRTYRFHVSGVRIGFFSVFPHIRSIEEV